MKNTSNKLITVAGLLVALVGIWAVGSGFTQAGEKYASIDITGVLEGSKLGKQQNEKLRNAYQLRQDLMNFIIENPVITVEQAQQLQDLTLKDVPTAEDKTKMEEIKKQVVDASSRRVTLAGKANKTEAEVTLLTEYNQRAQGAGAIAQQWNAIFTQDMDTLSGKLRDDAITEVKKQAREVAKKQGYTLVFEASVLIFSANDITSEVVKSVDAAN